MADNQAVNRSGYISGDSTIKLLEMCSVIRARFSWSAARLPLSLSGKHIHAMRQRSLFPECADSDVPPVSAHNRTFLERYRAGERKKVWRELRRLGPHVFHDRYHADALGVARETMTRALHNLKLIHARLVDLDYKFDEPDLAFAPAQWDAKIDLAVVENEVEYIPLSVRAWYEAICSVDFIQREDQLRGYSPSEDVGGLGDGFPMVVRNLKDAWSDRQQNTVGFFLPMGVCCGNHDPKGFQLPNPSADLVFYNDGRNMYFVDELRWYFKWGGFPSAQHFLSGGDPLPGYARPNAQKIIPILQRDLLEL
jgi:hypothetical protein